MSRTVRLKPAENEPVNRGFKPCGWKDVVSWLTGIRIGPGNDDHRLALEQRMFGVDTLPKAVGAKVSAASAVGVYTTVGVNKWLQHEDSAPMHSTRIRASSWITDSSPDTAGNNNGDSSDQALQLGGRGGIVGQFHLPGDHACATICNLTAIMQHHVVD